MLESLALEDFGVLPNRKYNFAKGLNVVIGSNGTGKSQMLKLAYTTCRWSNEMALRSNGFRPDKATLQRELADKLIHVFRPDTLGRLARRGQGRQRCSVDAAFFRNTELTNTPATDLSFSFSFSTQSTTEIVLERAPEGFSSNEVVFFPTKEVLSIYPGFAAAYRQRELSFDETYYDLCLALERTLTRGPKQQHVKPLLDEVEKVLRGKIKIENGRFSLDQPDIGNFEMPLVAEGLRKIGTVAYLLANGTLSEQSTLFWYEPETNLNPEYMKDLASVLVKIAQRSTQVFVATHSLFMIREFVIALEGAGVECKFFALNRSGSGPVSVSEANSVEEVEPIVSLDEELSQSDRYLQAGTEG
jgi:energy-coupling factor transporter ATP-binding protein EcfA2